MDILYEDNHLIAVNKQVSDLVQGDKTGDETLAEKVREVRPGIRVIFVSEWEQ